MARATTTTDAETRGRPHLHDADEIVRLYTADELSANQIAARLQMSRHTVIDILRRRGVERRGRGKAALTRPEIASAYQQGETAASIAKRAGVTLPTVYAALEAEGVERRQRQPLGKHARRTTVILAPETRAKLDELAEWLDLSDMAAIRHAIEATHEAVRKKRK